MLKKFSENSQENIHDREGDFYVTGLQPIILQKTRSVDDVFLGIFRKFPKKLFYATPWWGYSIYINEFRGGTKVQGTILMPLKVFFCDF